jgi:hypothetical protein
MRRLVFCVRIKESGGACGSVAGRFYAGSRMRDLPGRAASARVGPSGTAESALRDVTKPGCTLGKLQNYTWPGSPPPCRGGFDKTKISDRSPS